MDNQSKRIVGRFTTALTSPPSETPGFGFTVVRSDVGEYTLTLDESFDVIDYYFAKTQGLGYDTLMVKDDNTTFTICQSTYALADGTVTGGVVDDLSVSQNTTTVDLDGYDVVFEVVGRNF